MKFHFGAGRRETAHQKIQKNCRWEFLDMAIRESINHISVLPILSSFIATSFALLVQLKNFSLPLLINQAENQKHQLASMIVDYNNTKKKHKKLKR